jgi:beta-aspartyl-peptidase (threonine type)
MNCIIVHVGAGSKRYLEERKNAAIEAAEKGFLVLERGGSAIDAVVESTIVLEDCPFSNAGIGSGLNLEGVAEMDASIMTDSLDCGAVAAVKSIKNPIVAARLVMEKTDHIILSGQGAQKFVKIMGLKKYNLKTERSTSLYRKLLKKVKSGKGTKYFPCLPDFIKYYNSDTVGAVAMDKRGRLVVANSTAGIILKLPGRIGDTPVFGAGLYADKYGAVCATGHGEGIIRLCLSKEAVELMKKYSAQTSVSRSLRRASKYNIRCGLIAIDSKGNFGWGYTSDAMPTAYIKKGKVVYKE